jgi:hypothetical protein
VYLVEGQRVPVHRGTCDDELRARPKIFLAELKPRGAFLDASSLSAPAPYGWLYLGLYVLTSPDLPTRRPALKAHNESNVPGLYIIGDLAGAPVIKLAMAQGFEVIEHIAAKPDAKANNSGVYDLVIVGAGAAGLNAALAAKDKGLRTLVLEKSKVANTIKDFPEGKWVYAEPDACRVTRQGCLLSPRACHI